MVRLLFGPRELKLGETLLKRSGGTLWVISGHFRRSERCRLYPQKRTHAAQQEPSSLDRLVRALKMDCGTEKLAGNQGPAPVLVVGWFDGFILDPSHHGVVSRTVG